MNMIQLEKFLFQMAKNKPSKFNMETVEAVIHTIIRYYALTASYFEEDAIRTMRIFLEKEILMFS